jgi:S1/P1 Nuclease
MRLPNASLFGLLAGLAMQLAGTPASAWGPNGHQAVGAIADQLIAGSPTAKKVRQILGSKLQTAAGWADCARAVESNQGTWSYTKPGSYPDCRVYENPASEAALIDFVKRNASRCGGFAGSAQCRHKAYHFVDLPLQHPHYDPATPGTAPNDLVHAINATITVLQGGKSPAPFDIRGRKEALRLLAHYLGDLHQPLHVGAIYLGDDGRSLDPATPQDAHDHGTAGGNQIQLEGNNLHRQWDDVSDKLFKQLLAGSGAAEARKQFPATGSLPQWPADWASETASQAAKAFEGLKIGAKVVTAAGAEWPATAAEPAYQGAREALQHEQLVKAGARLAQVLTALWP